MSMHVQAAEGCLRIRAHSLQTRGSTVNLRSSTGRGDFGGSTVSCGTREWKKGGPGVIPVFERDGAEYLRYQGFLKHVDQAPAAAHSARLSDENAEQ